MTLVEGGQKIRKSRDEFVTLKPLKDMSIRTVYMNEDFKNSSQKFPSNYIRTTKYTFYSFVPVGLINQFYRFSNIYFLVISILQSIP